MEENIDKIVNFIKKEDGFKIERAYIGSDTFFIRSTKFGILRRIFRQNVVMKFEVDYSKQDEIVRFYRKSSFSRGDFYKFCRKVSENVDIDVIAYQSIVTNLSDYRIFRNGEYETMAKKK